MLGIYQALDSNDDKTISFYAGYKGKFQALIDAGGAPADLFGLLGKFDAAIISFVNTDSALFEHGWLLQLNEAYASAFGRNPDASLKDATRSLLIASVLHFSRNAPPADPPPSSPNSCATFLVSDYTNSADLNYVSFALLKNGTAAAVNLATWFVAGLDATVDTPFTYVISNRAGNFYVVDKFDLKSDYTKKASDAADVRDVVNFAAWTKPYGAAATQAALSVMASDANTAPTVRVYPDPTDTSGGAGDSVIRIATGSKIRFTYSKKAVGGSLATGYGCKISGTAHPELVTLSGGSDTGASVTPSGMSVTDLSAGKKETWVITLGSLDAYAGQHLTFDPTLVLEGNGASFALDPANSASIDFIVDTQATMNAETPTLTASLVDSRGTGSERIMALASTGTSPIAAASARSLRIALSCRFPGSVPPKITLWKPDDTSVDLSLHAGSLEITETNPGDGRSLDQQGGYRLRVEPFTNGAGKSTAALDCRFAVVTGMVAYAGQLEGWGYFAREEGAPDQCPEPADLTMLLPDGSHIPAWSSEPTDSLPFSAGLDSLLTTVHAANAGTREFHRRYPFVFKSADGSSAPVPSGRAYLESMLSLTVTGHATGVLVTDATIPGSFTDVTMYKTGVELRLRNGPFSIVVQCVEVGAAYTPMLAIPLFEPSATKPAFAFAGVSWTAPVVLRVEKTVGGGEEAFDLTLWNPVSRTFSSVLGAPMALRRLPCVNSAIGEAVFGQLEDTDGAVTSQFEYVRYAFADSALVPAGALKVGFANLHRTVAAAKEKKFLRSPDIRIMRPDSGGSADANDPQSSSAGSNHVFAALSLTRPAAYDPPAAVSPISVPVKVRFCLADWDESAADVTIGFFRAGAKPALPDYKLAGFITPVTKDSAAARPSVGIVKAAAATANSTDVTWNFLVNADLTRRLCLLACADAPFLDPPSLRGATTVDGYLDTAEDASCVRTGDTRCAVRQFLPDYYVRDMPTDSNPATYGLTGGWLSPDVALAVYLGPTGTGLHYSPDPQSAGAVIDGGTTRQATYPLAFSQGWVNDTYLDLHGSATMPAYDVPADQISTADISITDTGSTDYDGTPTTRCYYNRVWVRLSNRGVVPGPASVQIFFLDSTLFNNFDPATVRPNPVGQPPKSNFHWMWSNKANTTFVQSQFQSYALRSATTDKYDIIMVKAVPALSGWSTPDWALPGSPPRFVIAEFAWHVAQSAVTADTHGCRAICINLPGQTANTCEPSSSGVDEVDSAIVPGDKSIWTLNCLTNNVSVRNSNVIQGAVPPTLPVNVLCSVSPQGAPQHHQPFPNNFVLGRGGNLAATGIGVNAQKFPVGEIVLRVPLTISKGAVPKGLEEYKPTIVDEVTGKPPVGAVFVPGAAAADFRYFRLKGGSSGALEGIGGMGDVDENTVKLFFRPYQGAEPGRYEVTVSQLVHIRAVGGYRTTLIIPEKGAIRFVADSRTKAVYDVRRNPRALDSIPFARAIVFTDAGRAVLEGFQFVGADAVTFFTGGYPSDVINVARGYKWPKAPDAVATLPGGLQGAVVGTVVDHCGHAVGGCMVELHDVAHGSVLGRGVTDPYGHYLIAAKGDAATIPVKLLGQSVELVVTDSRMKGSAYRKKMRVRDLYFAVPDIILKV